MGDRRKRRHRHRGPEARQNAFWRAIILGFLGVVLLEGWIAWSMRESAPALGPLPQPNGYDELVRAAAELQGAPPAIPAQLTRLDDEDDIPPPNGPDLPFKQVNRLEVRAYLDANKPVLNRARLGLRESYRVPVRFVRGYAGRSQGPRDALAKLAGLFQWEAWLAESEDRQRRRRALAEHWTWFGPGGRGWPAGGGLRKRQLWFGYDLMNGGLAGLRKSGSSTGWRSSPASTMIQALTSRLDDETRIEPYARVIARQKQYDRAEGWAIPVAIVQFVSLQVPPA